MRLGKHLCLKIASVALTVAGGMLMLTAIGGTAMAVDVGPEIDPTTLTSAVTLFFGSVLLLTSRRGLK